VKAVHRDCVVSDFEYSGRGTQFLGSDNLVRTVQAGNKLNMQMHARKYCRARLTHIVKQINKDV